MLAAADAEKMLNRIHEWTRAADQKASIIVALQAGLAALTAPALSEWFSSPSWEPYRWVLAIAGVLWIASVVTAAMVLFARVLNKTQDSVTFFGDIIKLTQEEYQAKVAAMDDTHYRDDFINQIWVCADICSRKHRHQRWSIFAFLVSGGLILTCYVIRGYAGA